MINENHQNLSQSSLTNVDSSPRMQGWFKLVEAIRQSDPPSNESSRLLRNNQLNNSSSQKEHSSSYSTNTNGHLTEALQTQIPTITLDSPLNIFSTPTIISLESSPTPIIDDYSFIDIEPISTSSLEVESTMVNTLSSSPESTISKQTRKNSKRVNIFTLNSSKESPTLPPPPKPLELSTPITEDISDDDDIPLIDIRRPKRRSIDTLSMPLTSDSIIPLGTDIQSLPGHIDENPRDTRFLAYTDTDNLANHMDNCLMLDSKLLLSIRPHKLKSCDNVLNKIFRIHYIKTIRRNLVKEKKIFFNKNDLLKHQSLSLMSSPTAISFRTDWNLHARHRTSSHQLKPKNTFHILQLNPKLSLDLSDDSAPIITPETPYQALERVKDVLARTYYPHLYTAVQCRYQFGAKSILPNTQQLINANNDNPIIKQRPNSPCFFDDTMATITFRSPPSSVKTNSISYSLSPTKSELNDTEGRLPLSTNTLIQSINNNNNNEDISPLLIRESIVVLTPTPIPSTSSPSATLIDKEKKTTNNRKRKSSAITNGNFVERKKKKTLLSLSPSPPPPPSPPLLVNQYEDISDAESEQEILPAELPKQSFITNGLRSNYYKKSIENNSKSISKTRTRHHLQSSGFLPSFYTGLFQSDEEKSPHIDYRLPFDIYWHGQQNSTNDTELTSTNLHKKKKSSRPKQKQPVPYKKLTRNVYTDQIKQTLLSSYNSDSVPVCDCKPPSTCEDCLCVNKLLSTECSSNCACGSKCSNQKIRKLQWFKHLEVFDTGKYGQGLRTTANIPKGTFLCEYVGEVITEEKFQERMINLYSKDEHHYAMKLTQNYVIDAYRMGSIARFANHSCMPNCEFQKWTVDGLHHMCMFSSRTIKSGEELTYDYNFQYFNLQSQQPCYCENVKCRGTIGTKQQLPNNTITTTMINNNNNNNNNQSNMNIQRLTQKEKRLVLQSSIFLLRNLKRIKEKRDLIKKNENNKSKDKQSNIPLFFSQNYYHSNGYNHKSTLTNLRKSPKLSHKELFYLFYNHIRRSHFAKSGRYQWELIDPICYYAQLAQMTLIFNDIFDLILHYRCINEPKIPSTILQKCPSKRLVPAYYEIITKPIDLTIIRNKLDNGEYNSFDSFEENLRLLFENALTFCGEDSDEGRIIFELQNYFFQTVKIEYKKKFDLFIFMNENERYLTNLNTFEQFISRLHEKEVIDGQVREVLYDLIYCIDEELNNNSPIVYKIVLGNTNTSHRIQRSRISTDYIVHCRCGSVYDENSLVQCYACQLWQHLTCVSISDPSRPYYCFECQPICEENAALCLKTNVLITATLAPLQTYDDNHTSYSTLTRADGFIVRINECYFVPKIDKKNIDRSLTSPEYDILCVERLWIDDDAIAQASGFYYIRPNETFHEPTRKFFPNEVFRFPSSNDSVPVSSFVRSCFVFDMKTYTKGRPISDNSSRVLSSDIFICEYRVDKTARTFTRLVKSRQLGVNTKSYCFDNYIEKPIIKRDYQPYQKEIQQHHYENRRRPIGINNRLTLKQSKEKSIRINGFIEKIYCRFHDQTSIPNESEYSINQLRPSPTRSLTFTDEKISLSSTSSSSSIRKTSRKRPTISLSSDDEIVEVIPECNETRHSKKRTIKQRQTSPYKRDQ